MTFILHVHASNFTGCAWMKEDGNLTAKVELADEFESIDEVVLLVAQYCRKYNCTISSQSEELADAAMPDAIKSLLRL